MRSLTINSYLVGISWLRIGLTVACGNWREFCVLSVFCTYPTCAFVCGSGCVFVVVVAMIIDKCYDDKERCTMFSSNEAT